MHDTMQTQSERDVVLYVHASARFGAGSVRPASLVPDKAATPDPKEGRQASREASRH